MATRRFAGGIITDRLGGGQAPAGGEQTQDIAKYLRNLLGLQGAFSLDTDMTVQPVVVVGNIAGSEGGATSKVELVDAQGRPLATSSADPPVLGVEVGNSDGIDVNIVGLPSELQSEAGLPVVNKVTSQFQVALQAVDGGVTMPVEIKSLATAVNPLPVELSSTSRNFYGTGGVHVDSVANMTAVGVELVIPQNSTIYDLNVRAWMYDDGNGNVNNGWGLFRVGTPQGTWTGTNNGKQWPNGTNSQVYLRDPKTFTGSANFVATTLYETYVKPTPTRSHTNSSAFGVILIGEAGPFPGPISNDYLCWGFNDVNGNAAAGDVIAFAADWYE